MKFLLVTFTYFVVAASVSAQTMTGEIRGQVVDMRTKEALIGVNVIVEGTSLGASTDAQGKFIITKAPIGAYRLRFDYIGYEKRYQTDVIVKSAMPAVVNMQLKQSSIEGEEVVVTAGYFVEEDMVQTSTIGLSREEIRRYPGGFEDVVRTVSTLPGVAVNNAGGRNDLLVRGGGPSENLFIINGIEAPNINHFGTQGTSSGSLSFINLDFVQDVSFSTGGFSARYGDKMSSVLNLTMSEVNSNELEAKATISATQYGVDFMKPFGERGGIIFSARKSYLDLIFKAAGLPFVPVYTDFNLIANYDLSPKDKLFVLALSAIDDVDRDLSTLQNRVENAGILGNAQYQAVSGINYRRLLNWGYLDATLGMNIFKYGFRQADPAGAEFFKSDAREQEVNAKIDHYWILSKKLGLRTGFSSKTILNRNSVAFADTIYDRSGNRVPVALSGLPQQSDINATAQKGAAYAELDWTLGSALEINAGARIDYFGFLNEKYYPAPRLALKYNLNPRNSVRLSGGVYYQSPANVWTLNPNNKNLKALKNSMAVLGWDFMVQKDTRFSVESYYKKYDDLPSGAIPGVNDYIIITNTGAGFGGADDDFQSFGYFDMTSTARGRAYGVEFLLQKKFSDTPFYGLAGLTLNKVELTANDGRTYPGQYDQPIILNISGGYKPNSKWEFSAKFRYFSGVPYTPTYIKGTNPNGSQDIQNLPSDYLSARLNPGHHMDVRIDRYFNFSGSTLTVYADIQNIYNYAIPLRPTYNTWDNSITSSSAIGVLPSIGISWEF